jgi:hypothetical protein
MADEEVSGALPGSRGNFGKYWEHNILKEWNARFDGNQRYISQRYARPCAASPVAYNATDPSARDKSKVMPRTRTVRANGRIYLVLWLSDNRDQEAVDNAMDDEYRRVAQEICQVNVKFQLVWVRVPEYKFG